MSNRCAKALQIVMRHLVRIGAQRREFQAAFHGFEGERVHLYRIEDIFTTECRREEVVNPGEQRVAAEFPGVALAIETDGFSEMRAMLAGLTRQDGRSAEPINDPRNALDRI